MNLNIPENEKTPLVITLLEIIHEQRQEIEALKTELLKFKKETVKPDIKPSKLNSVDEIKPKRSSTKGIKKKKKK